MAADVSPDARACFTLRFRDGSHTFEMSDAAAAAHAVLAALFPDESQNDAWSFETPGDRVPLEAFQNVAAAGCRRALAQWGGVLLCDDVGLGKTYVALELVRDAVARGVPALVVVPSSLRSQWLPLLRTYAPRARMLTHAQLSRGSFPATLAGGGGIIVIDEAHALRTPRTRRYRAASMLCQGRAVCLVTATPVNNSIWDLYHLTKLFAQDASFAAAGIPDLYGMFDEVVHAASTPPPFRRFLRLTMVRRSRSEVRSMIARGSARLRFPDLAPPQAISYDPDAGSPSSHQRVLDAICRLNLCVVDRGSAGLLKYLLLKRLASSAPALRSTVHRLLRFHRDFIIAAAEGLALAPRDFGSRTDRLSEQLELRSMVLKTLTPGEDSAGLRATACRDVALLESILREIGDTPARTTMVDHKLAALRHLLFDKLSGRKVLLFTEFRETAVYLWRQLVTTGGVGLVHGGASFLGFARAGRNTVIERFARSGSGRRAFHTREQVRVLIATDVLSEGLNLQDCAHVVSYDLPWNPVRLIQRIGRIDRLGSPHDRIYSYNFVPDRYLEDYLGILSRLRIKLHAIGMTLGLQHPVLAYGDEPNVTPEHWRHLRDSGNRGAAGASRARCASDAEHRRAPDVPADEALRDWMRKRSASLGAPSALKRGPGGGALSSRVPVARSAVSGLPDDGACFVVRRGNAISAFICTPGRIIEIDPGTVAGDCIHGELCATDSDDLRESLRHHLRRLRRHLARCACRPVDGSSRASSRVNPTAVLIATRLQRALALVPGGPSARQLERVDHVLDTLGRTHSFSSHFPADQVLPVGLSCDELLASLEHMLQIGPPADAPVTDEKPARSSRPEPDEAFEIVAAILPQSGDITRAVG